VKRFRRDRRRGGFTLIEVLLVLVILVIIASLAAVNIQAARRKAMTDAAQAQADMFASPLDLYQLAIGMYPTTAQGLQALLMCPGDLPDPSKWQGPYLKGMLPNDPWGQPYYYQFPSSRNPEGYDVWSAGPDGVNGTQDDIYNKQ
jgi:general secretion pathway protein G